MRYIAVDVRDTTISFKDWEREMRLHGFTFDQNDIFLRNFKRVWEDTLWVLFNEDKNLEMYYDKEDAYFDDGEEKYPIDLVGCLTWMRDEIDEGAVLIPYQADKILLGRL